VTQLVTLRGLTQRKNKPNNLHLKGKSKATGGCLGGWWDVGWKFRPLNVIIHFLLSEDATYFFFPGALKPPKSMLLKMQNLSARLGVSFAIIFGLV